MWRKRFCNFMLIKNVYLIGTINGAFWCKGAWNWLLYNIYFRIYSEMRHWEENIRHFVGNTQKIKVEIYLAFIGPEQTFDGANRYCIAWNIVQCDPNKWDDKYMGRSIAKNKQMNFIYIMRISYRLFFCIWWSCECCIMWVPFFWRFERTYCLHLQG